MSLFLSYSRRGVWVGACAVALAAATMVSHASAAPPPFLWGVATSSYQVEGGITNNDYDFFNSSAEIRDVVQHNSGLGGPPITVAPAGEATRSWQPAYYRRDFDNARLLGLNSFRISLEWGRIEPADGVWDDGALTRYAAMIDAMRARGIRPIVTLNHFTLPLWVLRPPITKNCFVICYPDPKDAGFQSSLRGWENPAVVDKYLEFVRHVVPRLARRVDYWMTINEPVSSMVGVGYIGGAWSPGFVADGDRAKVVLHNLIEAHVRAYGAIHQLDAIDADGDGVAARVGVAHAMLDVSTADGDAAAERNVDYFFNDYFLDAVVNGEEDLAYLNSSPCCQPRQTSSPLFVVHPEWRNKVDFIGLNYYRRAYVFHDNLLALTSANFMGGRFDNNLFGHFEVPHSLLNDLGWAIYPQGLYDLLLRIKQKWNKPVLISENGIAERTDRNRSAFIVAHVKAIQRAMSAGVDVIGYLYWSLLDNWELQENYRPESRFGLFHVDRDPNNPQLCLGTCHRAITEGALAYRQIVAESQRSDSLGRPTPAAIESAQKRFGSYTDDGTTIIPPQQSYARTWQGRTSSGAGIELILMRTDAKPTWLGLVYWRNLGVWHNATIQRSNGVETLHEIWYDDQARRWLSRDHRLSGTGASLRGRYRANGRTISWTATPIPAVGLWQWNTESPWGGPANGRLFSISNLEGSYAGKFLSYPTASHGPSWASIAGVSVTQTGSQQLLQLDNSPLFNLTLGMQDADTATTIASQSGSWVGVKAQVPAPLRLGQTGDVIQPGEIFWLGQRSDGNVFQLSEQQSNFRAFEPGLTDQQYKERDETNVSHVTFVFQPIDIFFGVVTRARIAFDAAGRHYETEATLQSCLVNNVPCTGSWHDIAGIAAHRVGDGMPAFP